MLYKISIELKNDDQNWKKIRLKKYWASGEGVSKSFLRPKLCRLEKLNKIKLDVNSKKKKSPKSVFASSKSGI